MKKILLTILSIAFIAINANAQIPTTNLVGHYDFSSGALTDNINSANFTKVGTASTTITDRFGNANEAISLNGDDLTRPDINFDLSTANPYLAQTISFWVKTTTTDPNTRIIYNDNDQTTTTDVNFDGLRVYLKNGKITAGLRDSQFLGNYVTHSTNVNDNVWHHITVQAYTSSLSGTQRIIVYVFVDAVKEGGSTLVTSTMPWYAPDHTGNISFSRLKGASVSANNKYIDGLDEVLFYTRILTDTEVNNITMNGICNINIPDANFKAYLVGNAAINTNGDTEIQCSEASAFNGTINCSSMSISDLTGIEAFTALTNLTCSSNPLSTINVSLNTNLTHLDCFNTQLTALDVTSNTSLIELRCYTNQLTSLDVSANSVLENLYCNKNQLPSIDLSMNTSLVKLSINNNQLSSLDLSHLTMLSYLWCGQNSLLTSLNVANGNNINFTQFNSTSSPNLTCITVDDVTYSTTNWTSIDAASSFSTNCVSSPVLVNSISVQGQNGVSTITSISGALQMEATILPANADDATYTWTLDNNSIASLSSSGLLTAGANGTVTVTATANDGSGVSGSAVITISNQGTQVFLVNSIVVDGQNGVSTISTNGGTLQMEATVLPANATDATYTWSVDDNTKASISSTGVLTALANGTVEVTATANDASGTVGTKTVTISNQSVGINDLAFQNLNIYPNPTNGIINLNVSEKLSTIKIMDLTGKTIKEFNAEAKQLDISAFTSGIYFLEIANAERTSVVKIVKK